MSTTTRTKSSPPRLGGKAASDVIQTAFRLLGYKSGGLPGRDGREAAEIDAAVVASTECDECGHVGMSCLPFHRGRAEYRVVAVCPCGHCFEA